MTNKTFKEEVENRFDEQVKDYIVNIEVAQYDKNNVNIGFLTAKQVVNSFIISSLDLYKQKILEALPKEKETYQTNKDIVYDKEQVGYNKCLSEVKQIIENI